MKLKDLFNDIIVFEDIDGSSEQSERCVKICENYACYFAYWLSNDWLLDERWSKITEPKELLEIFKKEKGL